MVNINIKVSSSGNQNGYVETREYFGMTETLGWASWRYWLEINSFIQGLNDYSENGMLQIHVGTEDDVTSMMIS